MPSFTLDTNCIVDLDENRPTARHVRALADAHAAGRASVAVGAISASERQSGGRLLTNFQEFQQRLDGLRSVELAFTVDRNQLFTAWNALANLADLAGKINIAVRASSDAGFDQNKLENGVLEPLRETKLIE